jgi:hypothetical protein
MPPLIPELVTIDSDGRIQASRVPDWIRKADETTTFCVPLKWKRAVALPLGHELEAWTVWNATEVPSSIWRVDPAEVQSAKEEDGFKFEQKLLMYPARYDSKGRLCCSGLFSDLAKLAGRTVWLVPEKTSIAIWTNFAFNSTYGVSSVAP